MAAKKGLRTLDLAYRQVLVDFPEDDDGLYWHHRVLIFETLVPGVWVAVSPDFEVLRLDLNQHRVMTLGRDALFPASRKGEIYHFDASLTDEEVRLFVCEARELLKLLGGSPASAADTQQSIQRWIIADPTSDMFGEELPAGVNGDPDNFISPDEDGEEPYSVALVKVYGKWVLAQQVASTDTDEWRRHMVSAHGRDVRVLGDRRNPDGTRRTLTFEDAMLLTEGAKLPDTSLPGARAAPEFLKVLSQSGMGLIAHHLDFVHKSGVSPQSGAARSHRRVTEAMQLFLQTDQLNGPALDGFECLVRYLVQIETAVSRNPRAPDYADLEAVTGASVSETGALVLPTFNKFVAGVQQAEAFNLKQRRQWHEEQIQILNRSARNPQEPRGKGKDRDKGKGKGGGKATAGAQAGGDEP